MSGLAVGTGVFKTRVATGNRSGLARDGGRGSTDGLTSPVALVTGLSEPRGIAVDWTAWGEIGMASRGSVPAIMEALGIDMLPPESGVPI